MLRPGVIDLSHHNTVPQGFEQAKAAGILGVIHKMTEGITYTDDTADNRLYLANRAGLKFGTYHFLRGNDVGQQVAFYVDAVKNIQTKAQESAGWLWCLDYEDDSVPLNNAIAFLEQLAQATGQSPVLYSGHTLKDKLAGKPNDRLKPFRLWLAQYGSSYKLPPGYDKYWLWQYSDSGTVAGINPPTDVNQFDGSAEQLLAEWAGGGAIPAPEPQAIAVTMTVASDQPINLRIETAGMVTIVA